MTSYIRLTVDIAGPGGLGAGLRVGELALVAIVARPDRGVVAANGPFFHADLPNTPSPSKIIIIYIICVYTYQIGIETNKNRKLFLIVG